MEKSIITFGDSEIDKFHQDRKVISIKNININEIVVSTKASFGKKRFQIFHWLQRC